MKTATEKLSEIYGCDSNPENLQLFVTLAPDVKIITSAMNQQVEDALDELTKRFKGIKELNITPSGANKLLDAIEQLKSELK